MPRAPRLQLAGGIFHITSRGNRKHEIYVNESDRHIFLYALENAVAHYHWRCHAYCLMTNHFHLVIETPQPKLSVGMQRLNGAYGQWFNHRHRLSGHLFQGRFHSRLVENDSQLLELSRYVVLNPVRAGVCADPRTWEWSSLPATLGSAPLPHFLTVDWLLSHFSPDLERARRAYEAFVLEAAPRKAS